MVSFGSNSGYEKAALLGGMSAHVGDRRALTNNDDRNSGADVATRSAGD